jgi:succinate-semialdehyde dehydrogenase / glutarate-semialdehyde dehydrogenase
MDLAHSVLAEAIAPFFRLGSDGVPVIEPATGEPFARVPRADDEAVDRAVEQARGAQPAWGGATWAERASVLTRLAALMSDASEDLARLITKEEGKPIAEARGEIAYARSFVDYYGGMGGTEIGHVIASPWADAHLRAELEPIGVTAAITPWNFPSAMITRKLAPALLGGNAFVLKPAEATPLSAYALAALAREAGLPEGIFHVLAGSRDDAPIIGSRLTGSRVVRKLSFTGSTAVGKRLLEQCAATVKRVSLELGGNAPFIVFDDADLEAALEGLMTAKFRNSGQSCVSAQRVYVHAAIFDRFVDALSARVEALSTGPGFDERNQIGPMIDDRAVAKIERHVEDALGGGATLLLGGSRLEGRGSFYAPTLLVDFAPDAQLTCEETFGPVLSLRRFTDEADVLEEANDTRAGLVAYFYSENARRIHRVSRALDFGMVGVNAGLVSTAVGPFGGIKESGLGREGARRGLDDWTQVKYLCTRGLD